MTLVSLVSDSSHLLTYHCNMFIIQATALLELWLWLTLSEFRWQIIKFYHIETRMSEKNKTNRSKMFYICTFYINLEQFYRMTMTQAFFFIGRFCSINGQVVSINWQPILFSKTILLLILVKDTYKLYGFKICLYFFSAFSG